MSGRKVHSHGWLPVGVVGALTTFTMLVGCGEDAGDDRGATPNPGELVYEFESRFSPGESSVSYGGQTARHVLIDDLKAHVTGLTESVDGARFNPTEEGEVVETLDFYFRFDSDAYGGEKVSIRTEPPPRQSTYDDVSAGKNLVDKLAGNDSATDHRDWTSAFSGWSDQSIAEHGGGTDSPEQLVTAMFETIEAQTIDRVNGNLATGPNGQTLPVHVTEEGLDLAQLVQKFLLVAITFSQGADDYLDDDTDDKGLLADNSAAADGAMYTPLEHAWDEGFGYFGAARDYADYTDEEIAGKGGREGWSSGYHDTNGDGVIDLTSELNFGASVNAAKRDIGAVSPTDFTNEAFAAFVEGRRLITNAGGALSEAQLSELRAIRNRAIGAWEKAIAATVVHYINDTLQVMGTFGTDDYDFVEHAKVWSEMKGFALGFQFNRKSPMLDDFDEFHRLVGDAPVLENAEDEAVDAYRADLLAARTLLGNAYGFDAANLGDDNGDGGW